MAAPMAELPVEPQSQRKLSLNSLKRGLDLFSPLMALRSLSTHKAKGFESAIMYFTSNVDFIFSFHTEDLFTSMVTAEYGGFKNFPSEDTTDKSKHKTEQASTPLALPEAKGSKKDGGSRCSRNGSANATKSTARSGHLGWVRSVVFDPSNTWFCTGSADRTIKIWDVASGRLKLTLTGHIEQIRGLAVSQRHTYLFSAGDDKQV